MDTRKYGNPGMLSPSTRYPTDGTRAKTWRHAMTGGYVYAQTHGQVIAVQGPADQAFTIHHDLQTAISGKVSGHASQEHATIYTWHKLVAPYVNEIVCGGHFRVLGVGADDATVHHRLRITENANEDLGPSSFVTAVARAAGRVTPAEAIGSYAASTNFECRVRLANCSTANDLQIELQSYAAQGEAFARTASLANASASVVTAEVGADHRLQAGNAIWTSGFNVDIAQSAAVNIASVTETTITYTAAGSGTGDNGTGQIFADAPALFYRKGFVNCWAEVNAE